jgi:hypothetical protein
MGGYWNTIKRFEISESSLNELDPILSKTGMWNTISIVDLNGDGYEDVIAGNRGLNSLFNASEKESMNLYVGDLDGNGSIDPVVTFLINGSEGTFVDKMEFCEKMPQFNNKFLTNRSFAEADIATILGSDNSDRSSLNVEELRTTVLLNDSKGNFSEVALPQEVQLSPINAICQGDVDGDSMPETFLFGNSNSEFYDQGDITSNHGIVLKWIQNDGLAVLPANKTGLNISGVVNSCAVSTSESGWSIFLGRNDDSVVRISPTH